MDSQGTEQTTDGKPLKQAKERNENVLNTERNIMESVLERENLKASLHAVKANKGVAGIDGISTVELSGHLTKHWKGIRRKLEESRYKPDPVKTVEIPKPGGGIRKLGIPTVTDRFIQQGLLQVLDGIFDPQMSEHSYGFRKGRSAHQAVKQMKHYVVEEGRNWVIDLDLKDFFNNINHDLLMYKVSQRVKDKRVLKLIGSYLRAGEMGVDGKVTRNGLKGTPQGGPLSPLLANIYLDALDKEMEARGLSFVRYADDITIYSKSERSAHRTMESLIRWIEKNLKLEVNEEKSQVRPPDQGSFLGYRVEDGKLALSEKSIERFKSKVREIWNARWGVSSKERIAYWQSYLRGWWNYFKLTEREWDYTNYSGWIRRHMRKFIWQKWHNYKGRRNALRKLGVKGKRLKLANCSRGAWRVALALGTILTNKRLKEWGMQVPADLAEAQKETLEERILLMT